MENATKALTMAGGILIAIIVIATLMYSFQQWGLFPQSKNDDEKIAQLREFNNGFESYYKQNLYGTDIITVLNKAIANNNRYGNNQNDSYFVDVQVYLATPVDGYTLKTTIDLKTKEKTTSKTPGYDTKYRLDAGWHGLKKDASKLKELTNPSSVKKKKISATEYEETYLSVDEFKQRYFTCIEINYDKDSGRVKEMKFVELIEKRDPNTNEIQYLIPSI